MSKKIIAIVGLPGSGKSEVIKYLQEKFSWSKVYFGDVTFDEMKQRGLDINEANERSVREDLREKFGQEHYAKEVIKKIEALDQPYILVESLYSWPEYKLFKKTFGDNFIIIAAYAPPQIRYERLGKRAIRPLDAQTARSRDYAQIENLTQAGPIAMADYVIVNTDTLEKMHRQLKKAVNGILLPN